MSFNCSTNDKPHKWRTRITVREIKMSDVKNYELKGIYRRKSIPHPFSIVIRGLKEEEVIERAYSIIGGKHKVSRNHIKIDEIRVIEDIEEISNQMFKTLATNDDFNLIIEK